MKNILTSLLAMGTLATASTDTNGTDAFALQMFNTLAKEQKGNVVFSPASLEGVIHLLQQGARGETATELAALPMGETGVSTTIQPIEANALFIDKNLQLKPGIRVAELIPVSFANNTPQAVALVNSWAKKHTKGLIEQVLNASDVSHRTRLIAANAIYLKAKWSRPFDTEDTRKDTTFTPSDGSETKVDMMSLRDELRYAEGDDWQAVVLYYRPQKRKITDEEWVGFIGILPKGNAHEFAATLTPNKYQTIRRKLAAEYPQDTIVYLPRFDMDPGTISLKPALEACGVTLSFSPAANYTGFTDTELMLSDVLQRCRAKVDEEGTEAAAVTMAIVAEGACAPGARRPPKRIRFDRPFIWVITDLNSAAAPYFMGITEKP